MMAMLGGTDQELLQSRELRRERIGPKRRRGMEPKKGLNWILITGLDYLDVMSSCGDASDRRLDQ
jgi:hypothetical protein